MVKRGLYPAVRRGARATATVFLPLSIWFRRDDLTKRYVRQTGCSDRSSPSGRLVYDRVRFEIRTIIRFLRGTRSRHTHAHTHIDVQTDTSEQLANTLDTGGVAFSAVDEYHVVRLGNLTHNVLVITLTCCVTIARNQRSPTVNHDGY